MLDFELCRHWRKLGKDGGVAGDGAGAAEFGEIKQRVVASSRNGNTVRVAADFIVFLIINSCRRYLLDHARWINQLWFCLGFDYFLQLASRLQ